MLKILLTTLTLTTATIANAQLTAEQIMVNYKVACASDAEIVADQELLSIVGDNQQAAQARKDFQAFVTSPKAAVEAIVIPYNEGVAQLTAQLTSPEMAAELQTEAEKYVQENGGTVEEAKKIIIEMTIQSILAQQQIPPLETLVYQTTARACGLMNVIQGEITKTGCKNGAGEAIDMTAATQFCASVSTQLEQIDVTSGQLNEIQQQAQALINAVTASIQRDAEAQMAPLMETLNVPFEEVVKAAMDLVSVPETEAVEVPALPAGDATAPVKNETMP